MQVVQEETTEGNTTSADPQGQEKEKEKEKVQKVKETNAQAAHQSMQLEANTKKNNNVKARPWSS